MLLSSAAASAVAAGDVEAGRVAFERHCGICHGAECRGGEYARDTGTPAGAAGRTEVEFRRIVRDGLPDRGMPAVAVGEAELALLLRHSAALTKPAIDSAAAGAVRRG